MTASDSMTDGAEETNRVVKPNKHYTSPFSSDGDAGLQGADVIRAPFIIRKNRVFNFTKDHF